MVSALAVWELTKRAEITTKRAREPPTKRAAFLCLMCPILLILCILCVSFVYVKTVNTQGCKPRITGP